jgi:putative ABC transport system substrate-binding protein
MLGFATYVTAFRQGLAKTGYAEDRNVAIKYRWADGRYDRMSGIVAEFLRDQAVIIVLTGSTATVQAATAATQTVPIVFVIGGDPVKFGLVASLNRPGGNVTGVSFQANSLVAKQLDVLRELVQAAVIVGFLINPNNPNAESDTKNAHLAAETLGRKLVVVSAATDNEIDGAFAVLIQKRAKALLVSADPLFVASRDRVFALARGHALPTMYSSREYALAGGLLSYGPDQADAFRQAGIQVGRILKGEKPADLPVVQPTKFELVINLKTANALDGQVRRVLEIFAEVVSFESLCLRPI